MSGEKLESASFEFNVRVGPYTQAELDRAADACKPIGDGWLRWVLGYKRPEGIVDVIDCFGKRHGPGPSLLYPFGEGTVLWYRIREDLGVFGVDVAAGQDATVLVRRAADQDAMDDPARRPPAGEIVASAAPSDDEIQALEAALRQWEPMPPSLPTYNVLAGALVLDEQSKAMKRIADQFCGLPHPDLGKAMREAEEAAARARAEGSVEEWKQIANARQAALNAAVAQVKRLEAECESLSRQLRSREINAEPVAMRKPWRWSPLV